MELLQLKYFCDAAKTQNFSETAKKYYVPTSNISQTIKRLETELGTELFTHMSNKVILNEYGKVFYIGVKKALQELEEAKKRMYACKDTVSGEIKILALTNRRIVTKTIELFKKKYPEVKFVLNHNLSSDSEFDIIISDTDFGSSFDKTELISEDILLAVNKSHRLSKKDVINISELQNECFITMLDGRSLNKLTKKICISAGFEPNIVIQSDDPYYIRKYVELELGVAFVPERSWKGQISEEIILKRTEDIKRKTYISIRNDRFVSKAVSEFSRMIKAEAKSY